MSDLPAKNTGIIIEPPLPKDWIAGDATGVVFETRLADGDWRRYSITKELQFSWGKYDTMSCVTFSALNSFEMQVKWMLENKKIPEATVQKLRDMGFFDEQGNFNCSDWFTAVMSGTTPSGNTLNAVWESIRVHGVLPQSKGIKPEDVNNITEWLDPTKVTQEQKDLALKSKEIFSIAYEWILTGASDPKKVLEHLKQAPIHIATAVCAGWNTDTPVKACTQPVQHATCVDGSLENVATYILDHYDPTAKQLAWDYPIPYAIKGVVALQPALKENETGKAILPNAKKVVIINAGHHKTDTGAVHDGIIERDECYKVRDAVVPILEARGYTVHSVPDDLDLAKSIAWANEKAPSLDAGLAIDIHFNSLGNKAARGVEAFHGTSETSPKIAAALAKHVAEKLGIPNRGAKPDTQTAVGSLGWIRKTKMWASLIEVCFITNNLDMAALRAAGGYTKAATGIADAIDEIFGVKTVPAPQPKPTPEPQPQPECSLSKFSDDELLIELKKRMTK